MKTFQLRSASTRLCLAVAVATAASPALAHHPLAGAPMETFSHGLLSGVGHPLLGFDHLFFVAAAGVAALYTGRALVAPLAYVAAMLGGVGVAIAGVALPMVEPAIALSLLLVGGLAMAGRALSLGLAAGLFAVAGLFHGWAFGESIAGQEGGAAVSVTVGYLLGLGLTQYLIAVLAGAAVLALGRAASGAGAAREAGDFGPAPRLAGAMAAGVGLFLILEVVEGAAFAALGLGV